MHRDLILRASDGDHDAFTALAGEAFDRLHRTARLILRRDDLAADAVQEALLSAWIHIRAVNVETGGLTELPWTSDSAPSWRRVSGQP